MKKILKLLMIILFGVTAFSCSDQNADPSYNSENAVSSVLSSINSSYVLLYDNASDTLTTFTFTEPDFDGINFAVQYTLYADLSGSDFANAKSLGVTTVASDGIPVTVSKLNTILLALGVEAEASADVEFRVVAEAMGSSSSISEISSLYSNTVSTSVTTYNTEIVYPNVWVIGDYCGWSHTASQFLYSYTQDEINYEAVVDFGEKAASGFKITGIAGWEDDVNWGIDTSTTAPASEASSVSLIASGSSGNISCFSKRFYKLSFNTQTLLLKNLLGFDSLGIIGSGVGGWSDSDEIIMSFDTVEQEFYANVTLVDGEIKFRIDSSWTTNWGGSEGILSLGGDNIVVTAGTYRITVNLNNSDELTYSIE